VSSLPDTDLLLVASDDYGAHKLSIAKPFSFWILGHFVEPESQRSGRQARPISCLTLFVQIQSYCAAKSTLLAFFIRRHAFQKDKLRQSVVARMDQMSWKNAKRYLRFFVA
jgi:hypothetical protein